MEMKAVRRSVGRAVRLLAGLLLSAGPSVRLTAQDTAAVRVANDSLSVRFVDADIRAVIQALGRYLPKPVLVGNVQPVRVSLETPGPVSRAMVPALLKGLAESHNLEFTEDTAFFRIAPSVPDRSRPPGAEGRRGADTAAVQLFVIRLKHANAVDVAATVNLLFGGGGEFSGRAGLSTGTLSDELRRNRVPPAGADAAAVAPAATPPVRQSALLGPVTIVPDHLTNSLLVRASREDFDVIREAVDQLDIRSLQV
ncbi:MAG: secretin N-terminal domain-containing protein, partial [Gemmatimonadales bacterium]